MSYFKELARLDRQLMDRGLGKRGLPTNKGLYDLDAIKARIRDHDRSAGPPSGTYQKTTRKASVVAIAVGLLVALLGVAVAFLASSR